MAGEKSWRGHRSKALGSRLVGWREISRLAPKLTCSSAQFVDESMSGSTPGQLVGGTGLVQVANFFGALLPMKASLGKSKSHKLQRQMLRDALAIQLV